MTVANYIRFSSAVVALAVTATGGYAHPQKLPLAVLAYNSTATPPVVATANENELAPEAWAAALKRLAFLGTLEEDHNGEGALAPHPKSVRTATLFVRQLPFYSPEPLVGLDSDGYAVVEFHDDGEIGQVIFRGDGTAEAFYSRRDKSPVAFEGAVDDADFAEQFLQTFGFRFSA